MPLKTGNAHADAVAALARWPDDHGLIAQAFAANFGRVSEDAQLAMCDTLARWNEKKQAPVIVRTVLESDRHLLNEKNTARLAAIVNPECADALLAALPTVAELNGIRGGSKRVAHILRLLQEAPDARALPRLLEYLNDNKTTLRRHAAIVLGRIGSEEAIAALLNKLQTTARGNEEARRLILAGLHRSVNPRARLVLKDSLAGSNVWTRADAIDGLAETAQADDAGLVALLVADPHPQVRLRIFPAVPRLLPAARAAVVQMQAGAMETKRYRTALQLGEALGDAQLTANASAKLAELCQTMFQEPRLDAWLGKKQAQLKQAFPDAKVSQGALELLAIDLEGTHSSRMWDLDSEAGRLRFSSFTFGDSPCERVSTRDGYDQPVYGIRPGAPGDQAWEILGGQERSPAMWGGFRSTLALPDGSFVNVAWAMNKEGRVSGFSVSRSKPQPFP
jgi:hypothetical protein